MIPKIIWQTYKDSYENLNEDIKNCIKTWTELNPTYTHAYMNDEDCNAFILKHFGPEIYNLYSSFPLSVMRADFWRYCVLYIFGGVYADVDTVCTIPIDMWLKDDKDFICSLENDVHFCNWTFASTPHHPILRNLIKEIIKRNLRPNYNDIHFVHYLTGPAVFTDVILSSLNLDMNTNLLQYKFSENIPFFCYNDNYSNLFIKGAVLHLFGSKNWKENYNSWTDEREIVYKQLKSFSEYKQDQMVLKHYNYKKNGYFVDIGAYNGKDLSNTYVLEKDYDWKGLCFEPLKKEFEMLQKERPNSICINKAVFSESDKEFDFAVSNLSSGIKEYIDKHAYILETCSFEKVKSISLTDALDQNNAPNFIEYMSIDTEGSELEVLKGVDFEKYSFGIIHIEHNFEEPKRTNIKTFLAEKGYTYTGENNVDDCFAKI